MTANQITKFLQAVEAAELKSYSFADDICSKYYNSDNSICVYDENSSAIVSIRKTLNNGIADNNSLTFTVNDIVDIRKAEVFGTYEQIKKFAEEYGLSLTDEQLQIIVKIDRMNNVVKPITGDYINVYHKLSEAEYEALSDEEKAKYDAMVKDDEDRLHGIPRGRAATITC